VIALLHMVVNGKAFRDEPDVGYSSATPGASF
jgi:hypothetical protein